MTAENDNSGAATHCGDEIEEQRDFLLRELRRREDPEGPVAAAAASILTAFDEHFGYVPTRRVDR